MGGRQGEENGRQPCDVQQCVHGAGLQSHAFGATPSCPAAPPPPNASQCRTWPPPMSTWSKMGEMAAELMGAADLYSFSTSNDCKRGQSRQGL